VAAGGGGGDNNNDNNASDTNNNNSSSTATTTQQNPNLTFTNNPPASLVAGTTHTFTATTRGTTAITWSVTAPNDQPTNLATINTSSGVLTPQAAGQVKITAQVAAGGGYRAASITHTLTITRLPTTLAFGAVETDIPLADGPLTLTATSNSPANISWRTSNPSIATTAGTNRTATLTPIAAGSTTVTISVPQTTTHTAATQSITLTITLRDSTLAFTGTPPASLVSGTTHTFTATTNSTAPITWSVTGTDDQPTNLATINTNTGALTAQAAGQIKIIASVAAGGGYRAASISHTLEIISRATIADIDGDGLIEIDTLTMLHNMRYNLAGTSYKTSADATGITFGCPEQGGCTGYELTQDLDFDADGDGRTWDTTTRALDPDDNADPYFLVAQGGWLPIGDCGSNGRCGENTRNDDNPFTATLDGNGFVIRNLAIRRDLLRIGLFGGYTSNATIRNLGLEEALADYTGSGSSHAHVGSLMSYQSQGNIINSHASGAVNGGGGRANDNVGGLVGTQEDGTITASHASVTADGGAGGDRVGGLVGTQLSGGTIVASYATGALSETAGGPPADATNIAGGLVGLQSRLGGNSIVASYATGTVNGGDGIRNYVGGLVGSSSSGTIIASYSTGAVTGGDSLDWAGGLVGIQFGTGSITASYATGAVDGRDGGGTVGRLVGFQFNTSNDTASYGFGTATGETVRSETAAPVANPILLTATNAGSEWNAAASNALGAWNFGDNNQPPALVYNDYDGTSNAADNIDHCANFASIGIQCGTLIPNQRTTTTPQIGTTASDIQLTDGDTVESITGNINLPATFTLSNGTTLTLNWNVHHDPEEITTKQVTVGSNMLIVNQANRTSTRPIFLRATTGSGDTESIVNDYRLRIVEAP